MHALPPRHSSEIWEIDSLLCFLQFDPPAILLIRTMLSRHHSTTVLYSALLTTSLSVLVVRRLTVENCCRDRRSWTNIVALLFLDKIYLYSEKDMLFQFDSRNAQLTSTAPGVRNVDIGDSVMGSCGRCLLLQNEWKIERVIESNS